MPPKFVVSVCYSEITPESARLGDFSDWGIDDEGLELSFGELVGKLRSEFVEPSRDPGPFEAHDWASTGYRVEDYGTMTERAETLHLDLSATPARVRKWWAVAFEVAFGGRRRG